MEQTITSTTTNVAATNVAANVAGAANVAVAANAPAVQLPAPIPDDKKKKRPGRPKKVNMSIPVEVRGISLEPTRPDNIVEFVYQNPKIFKKLFTLCKAYESQKFYFNFEKEHIDIVAQSHLGDTKIMATIDCKCLTRYYCKEPIRVCIKRESFEKHFKAIDRSQYRVTIILKDDDYKSKLYLIIKDYEINSDTNYDINVIPSGDYATIPNYSDKNYPLKFQLPGKHFKEIITNIASFSGTLSIQKSEDEPLQFTSDSNVAGNMTKVYRDKEQINLQSTLPPDDIFVVDISVEQIKPFSNASIGDIVDIAVDRREPISFTTKIDKTRIENTDGKTDEVFICVIKVFVKIKKIAKTVAEDIKINNDETLESAVQRLATFNVKNAHKVKAAPSNVPSNVPSNTSSTTPLNATTAPPSTLPSTLPSTTPHLTTPPVETVASTHRQLKHTGVQKNTLPVKNLELHKQAKTEPFVFSIDETKLSTDDIKQEIYKYIEESEDDY